MTPSIEPRNFLRRLVLGAGLSLVLLLFVLSIYGAFIGAEAAQRFFNSIPLAVYWFAFGFLLVAGIALFPRLLCVRGLFLLHLGCVLILLGGLWGSRAGLKMQDSLFGTYTIHSGQMVIFEGDTKKTVETENGSEKELPFAVKLVDFKIEYYDPGQLLIQTARGEGFKIPAVPGTQYSLGNDLGSVEIVKKFKRFRLVLEGDKRVAVDDPNGGLNPALELLVRKPDGAQLTKYVFALFAGHQSPDDALRFFYIKSIRDFISDLEVVKDNKVLVEKSIEVNKPLHFGGYFFYQSGYDSEKGLYTVLRVTSDKGLVAVYLGYILLCAGAFWHLWLRHIFGDRIIED
jgi:hypothetical protein